MIELHQDFSTALDQHKVIITSTENGQQKYLEIDVDPVPKIIAIEKISEALREIQTQDPSQNAV